MKDFFMKMFSADTEVSSKRFTSVFALLLLTVVIICSLLSVNVPEVIIYALVSIILGSSTLTLIKNQNNTNANT